METIVIKFESSVETANRPKTFEVSANVVSVTAAAIERALAKFKRDINTWLLFGNVPMTAVVASTGEVVATGWYDYNAFAGHGDYSFKFLR